MTRRGAMLAGAVFAAGCAIAPADPFARAEAALQRGDLLTALRGFEAVPANDARRGAALANAFAIESRLRRAYSALYEGIVERGNGNDGEALACLQRAREVCPQLPAVDAWIAATRARLAFRPSAPVVVDDAAPGPSGAGEPAATPTGETAVAPEAAPDGVVAKQAPKGPVARPSDDTIAPGLVAVEGRLAAGELELAVVDLLELARRHPDDARVANRLARVLHQRALLRYGEGALAAAIDDWQQVLAMQPDNRVIKLLVEAARTEAASPTR